MNRRLDIMEFPLGNSTTSEKGTRRVWSSLYIFSVNTVQMPEFKG